MEVAKEWWRRCSGGGGIEAIHGKAASSSHSCGQSMVQYDTEC